MVKSNESFVMWKLLLVNYYFQIVIYNFGFVNYKFGFVNYNLKIAGAVVTVTNVLAYCTI